MSENEIKPVAWMVDEQGMTGQLGTRLYWARNGGTPPSFGQNHSPLYDQSVIDRLTAEWDFAREEALFLRSHRPIARRLQELEAELVALRAERDAAAASYTRLLAERQP